MSYSGPRQRRRSLSRATSGQFDGNSGGNPSGLRGMSRSPSASRMSGSGAIANSGASLRSRSRSPGVFMRNGGGNSGIPHSSQGGMLMGSGPAAAAAMSGGGFGGRQGFSGGLGGGVPTSGQVFTGGDGGSSPNFVKSGSSSFGVGGGAAYVGGGGGGGCSRGRSGPCQDYCVCSGYPAGNNYGAGADCYYDNDSNCCNSCCWGSNCGSSCCWGSNCGGCSGCSGCDYNCCDRKAGCTILWAIVLVLLVVGILMALAPFMVSVTAAGTFFAAPYAASAWYSYYPATIVALAWLFIFLALAIAFWGSDWVRCIGCCNDNCEYIVDNGWWGGYNDGLGCNDGYYSTLDAPGNDCNGSQYRSRPGLVIDWVILSWVIATVLAVVLIDAWLDSRRVAYELPVIVYLDETLVDIAVFYLVYRALLGRLNFWINLIVTVIVTSIIVSVRYAILGFGSTYSVGQGLVNLVLLFAIGALFAWIWDFCRLSLRLDTPDCGPIGGAGYGDCAPEFIDSNNCAGTVYPFAGGASISGVGGAVSGHSAFIGSQGPVRTVPVGGDNIGAHAEFAN